MNDDYDLTNLPCATKKRTNSKAKGSRFERKIAGMFNDRLGTQEFSRTPGSGAFATSHTLPDHLQIYGDLIAPKNFRYCIECKKGYSNIKINHLLDYSSQLWKFIEQCEKDSIKCNKEPMVLFQQDRQPILAITEDKWLYGTDDTKKYPPYIKFGKYQGTKYIILPFEQTLEEWNIEDWFTTPPSMDYLPVSY
jgi:Holliday junction resolvase